MGFFNDLLSLLQQVHQNSDVLGYLGAILTISAYSMRTMIPLRIVGIGANFLFIAYGIFAPSYPQLLLHSVLLPLNFLRLYQMMRLVKQVKMASVSDLSMDWLKPFTRTRSVYAGETIFKKGESADAMFYVVSGRYSLVELGLTLRHGDVVGEIGWVAPDQKRTQTFRADSEGELLEISYDHVSQLYFQNPKFGFFFLKLVTKRLLANFAWIEKQHSEQAKRREVGA
jgi:CRP/FNR family transcriptional regulator, cyclic AMP receptor protein